MLRLIRSSIGCVWLALVVSLCLPAISRSFPFESDPVANNGFRWVLPASDPQLWEEIQTSFADELKPDEAQPGQQELDIYRNKFLEKVGVLDHSALVIVCHRPANEVFRKNSWDEYCSAFNFDLISRQKSKIEHSDWMWKWKFLKLVKFGPSSVPDITLTYLTCTECEPETVFASLYYDATKSAWLIRSWGDGKDLWWTANDGLVVDRDLNDGSDTISFDCVYGIKDLNGRGFEDLVIRCKEVTYTDQGRAKIDDTTVLYGLSGGKFKRRRITNESEALALTAKVCRPNSSSWLCKLPGYMTATSGQNAFLDQMFPRAPKASREVACFRGLKQTTTMSDVAQRCGVPDELGGSGINIFIYHLDDGSLITIGATDVSARLLYANYANTTGKVSDLLAGN